MVLKEELQSLKGEYIAVTMIDGQAYRGKLVRFDDETMVLTDVYETSSRSIIWENKAGNSKARRGYIPWHKVMLPRVIIRVQMVLRVWPWKS